jgi:hypothetical protein
MAFLGVRWVVVWGLLLALFFASNEARAEDGYKSDERNEVFSLTFSPLHLFFPAVEVQGEYKVVDGLGVSLIAGYGWPTAEATDQNGEDIDVRFDLIEVGTQVMWYPLRRFRSLQLGVEAVYIHLSTTEPVGTYDASAFGGGFGIGPLVGFKFIVGPGFTGFIQLGVSYIAVQAEATDSTGARETEEQSGFGLNLNANVGWSF